MFPPILPTFNVYDNMANFMKNPKIKDNFIDLDKKIQEKARSLELNPATSTKIDTFVLKVINTLKYIQNDPESEFKIDEVRNISMSKIGLAIPGAILCKIFIVFKNLPAFNQIKKLIEQLQNRLNKDFSAEQFLVEEKDFGFSVTSDGITTNCLVSTPPTNFNKLIKGTHIAQNLCKANIVEAEMFAHFEGVEIRNETKSLIKVLIFLANKVLPPRDDAPNQRLTDATLTNIVLQFSDVEPQFATIGARFVKVLRAISTGLLLPGSLGVADPLTNFEKPLAHHMTQDTCLAATRSFQLVLNDVLCDKLVKYF